MISIIIPVYNCIDRIQMCIDSILKQSYTNYEIIIINDGSIDGDQDQYNEISNINSKIRIIHQENSGVSLARNNGLKAARGEYISFIDADDYIDSNYFEELMNGINIGADISYCSLIDEDEDKKPIRELKKYNSMIIPVAEYDWNGPLQHPIACGALIKREIINGISFSSKYYVGEDSLFIAQCISKSNILYYTGETKYHYIHYKESACHGAFNPKKMTEIEAWKEIFYIYKTPAVALAYNIRIFVRCKDYFSNSDFRKSYFANFIKQFRNVFMMSVKELIKLKRVKLCINFILFYLLPHIYMQLYCIHMQKKYKRTY